jgi:hypothetical protein
VRLFSSCLYLCSIVFICACVFLLYVPLFNCFYLCVCFPLVCTFVQLFLSELNKCTNKKTTHAQIKIIEQRYIQEENTRTDKNKRTKAQTRLSSSCLYLCSIVSICTSVSSYLHFCSIIAICVCIFFLFVPLFNCFYLYVCFLNKGAYKRKTHAQIKTIEQMYKQEEDTYR